MRQFRKFVIVAIAATFFLIFVGGLVRVSGAGMGCPDWPTCFGRWIPPTDISQLPDNIDPAQFNFTLAWIEYVNRLIGVIVGLFIAISAFWALLKYRKYPGIVLPSAAAAILVAYQGWQGGRMIESHLDPFLVSIHMGLAFIIVCLLIYVAQRAYYIENEITPSKSKSFGAAGKWLIGLIVISIAQVVQGTQVRTALEEVARQFPLLQQSQLLTRVDTVNTIHVILGIAVTLLTWHVGAGILKRQKRALSSVSQVAWSAMILASIQLIMGLVLIVMGVPELIQVFHLVLSSLFIGALVLLWMTLRYEGRID